MQAEAGHKKNRRSPNRIPRSTSRKHSEHPLSIQHLPGFFDPVSSLSHLLGAGLFLVLGTFLIQRGRGDCARVISLCIYVLTAVFLLSMSGVYHMLVRGSGEREVLERLDRGGIFLLIAGSFTPAHVILFRGWLRWGVLLFIWSSAIAGVTLSTIFHDDVPSWLRVTLFLGLGWLGWVSMALLYRRHGFAFVRPALLGGVAFTVGGIIEYLDRPILIPGVIHSHELFHFIILSAIILHWRFTWQFASWPVARTAC